MKRRMPNTAAEANARLFPVDLQRLYVDLVEHCRQLPRIPEREDLVIAHESLSAEAGWSPTWPAHCCMVESGSFGLRDHYFRANQIAGRMDLTFPFRDLTSLFQFVALATGPGLRHEEITTWLERFQKCSRFVILCDLALSGNSIVGDIRALDELRRVLGFHRLSAIYEVVLFCGTVTARRALEGQCDRVVVINEIPDCFSARDGGSVIIQLGHRQDDIERVCVWFRDEIMSASSDVHRVARAFDDPRILLWGFGGEGWLVAGNPNTPNNALPLLWVSSEKGPYVAPFPRVPSRLYEHSQWNLRAPYIEIIRGHLHEQGKAL